MVQIYFQGGRYIPMLTCDICGSRIADAAEGAAVFATLQNDGDRSAVMHVHKYGCHEEAEARLGGRERCSWQKLATHFLYLTHNSGLPINRLNEIAKFEGEFGF